MDLLLPLRLRLEVYLNDRLEIVKLFVQSFRVIVNEEDGLYKQLHADLRATARL